MSVWYKQGVFGELHPLAAEGLRITAALYTEYSEDVYITSVRESTHGAGSYHPNGLAWDQRPGKVPIDVHRKRLGPPFQIIDHGNPRHRHIEFDLGVARKVGLWPKASA